jgi:hypothetical protein
MDPQTTSRTSKAAALTLVTLQSLPCGCVSAVYRARPTVVELELVEAKGPHCLYLRHQTGKVVRLGLPEQILTEGDEAAV